MTGAKKQWAEPALLVLCALLLTLLNLLFFGNHYKIPTLVVCIGTVVFCIFRRKHLRFSPSASALAVYLLICALSGIGAVSGKFFIKEFAKLLMAFPVFLVIFLSGGKKYAAVRTAFILAVMAAAYSLISVELGSTAAFRPIFDALTGLTATDVGFEPGTRLIGVFGNANVLSSVLAIGSLLSVHLMVSDDERYHIPCSITLSFCVFGFVLAFSLGGTVFFALSCLLYLILSGEKRSSVFLVMLEHFPVAALFAFGAFSFFGKPGALALMPPVLMLAGAAVSLYIFLLLHGRLMPRFQKSKTTAAAISAAVLAIVVYICAAVTFAGSYHYDAEGSFSRSVYLPGGWHSLTIESDGIVGMNIFSQTNAEIITRTESKISSHWLKNGETVYFYVPEDSQVQRIALWAKEGRNLDSVTIDEDIRLKLDYLLLPDFIANRIQGVLKSQNAVQRAVFFADGLKLFKESPILGSGLGSFESAACSVQSYYYETRYVHNHYIQTLADCGLLGLAAYLCALILLVVSLIRRRSSSFAVLGACLFMIAGHSFMEVIMSLSVYLPFAFGIFAMISADDTSDSPKVPAAVVHWCCTGIYAVFAVLTALNIYADSLVDRAGSDYAPFMNALADAAAIDPFEYNDYKVSYVYNSLFYSSPESDSKAEQYAAELSTVRSNSTTGVLLQYYLEKQQYDTAFRCAMSGMLNNRSDSAAWNKCFGMISFYLTPSELTSDQAQKVMELYAALEDANSVLMTPVTLYKDNISYIQAVSALVS